jgi:hypothetical protein
METIQVMMETLKAGLSEGWTEEEVLGFVRSHLGKDPVTDARLVEGLGHIPDARIGGALQKMLPLFEDKTVRKGIKRSLYRIKSRGIVLPDEVSEPKRPILRPIEEEPPRGLAGVIDGVGNRALVLGVPQLGMGYTVLTGVVSDTVGWIDFSGGWTSKKGYTAILRDFQGMLPLSLVETEPAYVLHLFEEAQQLTLQKGRALPQNYLSLRANVEKIRKDYEKPLVYTVLEPDRGEEGEWLLERSGSLLRTEFFGGWLLEREEIEPYVQAVVEANESRLILSEVQRRARIEEVYRQALAELFPEVRRLLYKRRLEEMAYVLLKLEKAEEARMALAAAVDLERPFNLFKPNPFLFELVVRSILSKIAGSEAKEEQEPSLIIRP